MAAPTTTIWPLDPHTSAKHAILRRYLQAWIPILTLGRFPRVAYFDGFAGPGKYSGGEDGSPVIALKAALEQNPPIRGQVIFRFVEEKPDRAEVLQQIVKSLPIPNNFDVKVEGGRKFEAAFKDFRTHYVNNAGKIPPTFAFIDPFGWTGAPFSAVQFLMSQSSCEAFITFMYEEINRFIGHPDQEANFDALFGSPSWRSCASLSESRERNRCLHDLYLGQLRGIAKYVRSFEMRNAANRTDYFLFFATNNFLGLKKMKESMWKVDKSGEFSFADTTDPNQTVLFDQPNYALLKKQIMERFKGQETTVDEIEEFIVVDTAFRETHYKREVLRLLELTTPPAIEAIDPPPGRKRGQFPSPSLRIRFL